ncbi:MAG: hypothetical protein WCF84_14435 [Anaerolineae bacterium]
MSMFTDLLPSIQNSFKRIVHEAQARFNQLPTFGGVRTVAWIAAGLLLVALVYLAQTSNAALIAHNLHIKEAKIQDLEKENAELRYEIASITSPASLEDRAKKLGLGPAKRVIYANLPALAGDDRPGVVDLPARVPDVQLQSTPIAGASVWDQLLALLGLGQTDRAEAQSQ